MALNFKDWKKINSDKNFTTIRHKSGSEIKVAHSALHESHRKELEELPHFAHGTEDGPIEMPDELKNKDLGPLQSAQNFKVDEPVQKTSDEPLMKSVLAKDMQGNPDFSQLDFTGPKPTPPAPVRTEASSGASYDNAPLPASTNATDTNSQMIMPNISMEGLNRQIAGKGAEATALGNLGKEEAGILRDQQAKQAQVLQDYQNHYNQLDQERQAVMEDIKNGHIDPEHYINDMSSIGKVSTAIGLILGGMGGGGTHNAALDFLNKQIDRDVEAQKVNLGKKENLLKATMQQFGNMKDASQMTKAIYTDLYASKLGEAAAKAKDPLAKAQAMQAQGQLIQQRDQYMNGIAMNQALVTGVANGHVGIAQAIPFRVPKEQQKEAFDQLKIEQDAQKSSQFINKTMQEIADLQKVGKRISNPFQSLSQVEALNTSVDELAKSLFGKVSDNEIGILQNNKIKLTDNSDTVARKIKLLQDGVTRHAHSPMLDGWFPGRPSIIKKPLGDKKNTNVRD